MGNQSIILHLKDGAPDKWHKYPTKDVIVDRCVVQPQIIYSGDSNNRKIIANAIVYFYADITMPMPELTREDVGSTLTFEDKEYTITQIIDNRNPFSNELWSYEVEVL
ncbi:capsid protein [Loigolactobacillus backii]|nr:capsid protein [Loigolactobacillus backii]